MYDWKEYYKFARELKDSDPAPSQTILRNILSRAYYAAHNIARQKKFEIDGIPLTNRPRDVGIHKWVSDYYTNSDREIMELIADQLKELLARRVDADYKEWESFNLSDAEDVIQNASAVIQNMSHIR